jgi:hypothetical protein
MKKNVSYLVILSVLAALVWYVGAVIYGVAKPAVLFLILLVVAGLIWITRKMRIWGWIIAGLLVLGLSFFPTARLTQHLNTPPEPLNQLIETFLFWMPTIAILMAAKLFYSSVKEYRSRSTRSEPGAQTQGAQGAQGWLVALVLGALILGKTLINLYWLMVWDSTDDSLGFIWLIVPSTAALMVGVVFFILLPGWRKLAGFAAWLFIPLMLVIMVAAKQVDYRVLTRARADRVAWAIEAYHAREGRYPQSLRQLVPGQALILPGPAVLYGQAWCYDGGAEYYRLAYVEQEHWSAPILIVRVFKTAGEVPVLPAACAAEVAALLEGETMQWSVSEVGP